MTHIYAFGSICRGDVTADSDIDLLALVEGRDPRFDPDKFSIYSYKRISELWKSGNAFAWHLARESKLIHSDDNQDFLRDLGVPSEYRKGSEDCRRFEDIFQAAFNAVRNGTPNLVFELSTIFLAIRNIATCYSLANLSEPIFGRDSARRLGDRSVPLSDVVYSCLMRARLLSTRGLGDEIFIRDTPALIGELENCRDWIEKLCLEVDKDG